MARNRRCLNHKRSEWRLLVDNAYNKDDKEENDDFEDVGDDEEGGENDEDD